MIPTIRVVNFKHVLLAIAIIVGCSAFAQEKTSQNQTSNNEYGIENHIWTSYLNKTNVLLESVDEVSFINYVIMHNDGNFYDRRYFVGYVRAKIEKDKAALVYKVGKGSITSVAEINSYFSSLQSNYSEYFKEFQKRRDIIVEEHDRAPSGGTPVPFNCGSPCTNPGFESGTGFWDYWTGTACANSTSDPCGLVAGYSATQHPLQSGGGFDATVGGTILPIVPPGGGSNSMMLGDGPTTGGLAARASISFTVSAANANFTYKYAVVLQDPVSGHTDPERPYFNVRVRDASGNVVPCGDYEVIAKPPIVGFTETSAGSAIWYRNWTTVFIPLSTYIGQCVTIQFTSSDCSQGGHFGYAYIDGDCDPLQLLTSSPAVCGGSSVILTAPAGAASYVWSNTAGGTTGIVGSTTNQTATVNAGGTYQCVITTVSGAACVVTLNITVGTSPANPVASFTNTTVCSGAATTFTDTSTPVGSINGWAWDFDNDGVTDSNLQNPTHTFPAAGSYPVTLVCSWGPCNSTITQNVIVNAGVSPLITAAGPFCVDAAPSNLTANIAGGVWSGTGITNSALGTFDPASATIGNNTITYSVGGACPGSITSVIVVNPLPIADAGLDITICSATTGNLGTATTAGYNYLWTPGTGLSSTTLSNPTVTLTNATASPVTSTYNVLTTIAATGCLSNDQVDVTVNPVATANAGPAQTICIGSTVTLAGTVGGSAVSGTWSGGTGTYAPSSATLNAVYTPSAAEESAGTVTLTLSTDDPAGPCPLATSTTTITINPVATISAGVDQTICIGNAATLAGTIGGSTTTGTWTGGAGTFAPSNTTPTATYTPTAGEEAFGSVTLTFTSDDPAGPCPSVLDQMVLTISPLPAANAGLDQTICDGTSATLAGSISGAATSGTWSGGAGTFAPSATTLNATYTPTAAEAAAGSVTLTLTTNDPAGPCTFATDQMIITINPVATINAGPDQTICIGTTATLAGVIGGSALTGTWSGGAGAFAPSVTTANAVYTPSAAENAAGTVTLTFTSDDPVGPCGVVSDVMTITINQLPTANAGVAQSVCSGGTITLGGAIGGSATSGTWSGGTGTYFPNANALNAVYTPSAAEYAAGTVTLLLTTNDPAGPCSFATSSVTHIFYQNPVINFTVDFPSGCPVHCATFTDASSVAGPGASIVSWDWNFGDGGGDSTVQNPYHCFAISGYYDITLTTTSNFGCVTTLTIPQMVHVFDIPDASFDPNPNPATVLDPTITMTDQSTTAPPAYINFWYWNFGDGDTLISNSSSNPVHVYPSDVSSSYDVTLIVQNSDGCWDTVQHPVFIGPEFTFFIPNAFTPNGDGVNDYFYGAGIGIIEYDLWVFDRWGNMIFHGSELSDKWNGKANGGQNIAQQDVYVWKVKLRDVFNKPHNYIGTVTLVK